MNVGDRFTSGKGRYDRRVFEVMSIDTIDLPISGKIVWYKCKAENSIDWWFLQNPDEAIKAGDVKIVGRADALDKPETAAKVKGFIDTTENLRPRGNVDAN